MTLTRTFGSARHQLGSAKTAAVDFRWSAIYLFCVSFALIDFLDIADLLDFASFAPAVKYGYAVILLVIAGMYAARSRSWDLSNLAPVIALLLFLITGLAFVRDLVRYGEPQSYVSAFLAALVYAIAMFIPANSMSLNSRKISTDLMFLLSIGTVFYLIEAIVKPLDVLGDLAVLHEAQFAKSIVCVLALCLSILTGRNILTLFLAIVTVIALALRPTSTLAISLCCCVPLAMLLRLRVLRVRPLAVLASRIGAMTILGIVVITPLVLYFFFDQIADRIKFLEEYLKVDILGGESNTSFRLDILRLAFSAFDATSFWYGSALAGSINVPIARQHEWWFTFSSNGLVPIHSDFVIVLVLMGIIGYVLFSTMFYLALKSCFRQIVRREVNNDVVVLHSIAIVAVVALVIYCSVIPFLVYYNHTHVAWMLLLISQIARKARVKGLNVLATSK